MGEAKRRKKLDKNFGKQQSLKSVLGFELIENDEDFLYWFGKALEDGELKRQFPLHVIVEFWKTTLKKEAEIKIAELEFLIAFLLKETDSLKDIREYNSDLNFSDLRKIVLKLFNLSSLGMNFAKKNGVILLEDLPQMSGNFKPSRDCVQYSQYKNLIEICEESLSEGVDGIWEMCPIHFGLIKPKELQYKLDFVG